MNRHRGPAGTFLLAAVTAALSVVAIAGQQAGSPPQFRARTDLIQLDVSVLDRDRKPVRGLDAADFTIKEDGKLQKVETFKAIDLPDPLPPSATWMRDVAPDVTSNQISDRRLVVLVVDNWTGPETWETRTGKEVARGIIDRLGSGDVAAVIVVDGPAFAQDFTADHARLLAAVEQKNAKNGGRLPGESTGGFMGTLLSAIDYLTEVPDRRKAVIYIGTGNTNPEYGRTVRIHGDLNVSAKKANVNIYCFDVNGLRAQAIDPNNPMGPLVLDPGRGSRELMLALSNQTGGDATVNTNRPMDGVPQIFVENSSYYLLGYVSTNTKPDGKLRQIDVKVNRPRVLVRSRKAYFAPMDPGVAARLPPPAPIQSAVAGLLPDRGMPMDVTLAPFKSLDPQGATLAMIVGVATASDGSRATGRVDLVARAFTNTGEPKGQQSEQGQAPASEKGGARVDLSTEIPIGPGRYEVRIAATDRELDRTGSVFAFADVPDFVREPISLSGLVLSESTSFGAGRGSLAWLPIVPTTRREFLPTQRVSAYIRIYEGNGIDAPITLRTTVTNDHDVLVHDQRDEIAASAFDRTTRTNERLFQLPIATLEPGSYLLTLEASLDARRHAARHARFSIVAARR